MSYKVVVQDSALVDVREYTSFIRSETKNASIAAQWLDSLEALIASLADMPNSFKTIGEQEEFEIQLRQVIHHSHRVIYHVNDETNTVHILRVYHGARRPLASADIPNP